MNTQRLYCIRHMLRNGVNFKIQHLNKDTIETTEFDNYIKTNCGVEGVYPNGREIIWTY